MKLQPENTVPQQLEPSRALNAPSLTYFAMLPEPFGSTMQAGTAFATDLLTYGHVVPNTAEQLRSNFEHPGSGSAPSSVPIATLTPQSGSLGLVGEQTSAPVVLLPVQFSDLAVSALIDSRTIHNFLAASLLPKLRDSHSFVSIVPCQL